MSSDELLEIVSGCFVPLEEGEWEALTSVETWEPFVSELMGLLKESNGNHSLGIECCGSCDSGIHEDETSSMPGDQSEPARKGHPEPVHQDQTDLSCSDLQNSAILAAIATPPTYAQHKQFLSQCLTGGLPTSAMPVESLYVHQLESKLGSGHDCQLEGDMGTGHHQHQPAWMDLDAFDIPSSGLGYYRRKPAYYMEWLLEQTGFSVPEGHESYPDHLSIELCLASALIRAGQPENALEFLRERFAWLPFYQAKLRSVPFETDFYYALLEALRGVLAVWFERNGFPDSSSTNVIHQ